MTGSTTLDRTFTALASGPRREIVAHLAAGPATTPEVGRRFGFSKQALNKHIVVLEDAGIVHRTLRGRVHELRLVAGRLDGVTGWVADIREIWEHNLDRLGQVLEEER